MDRLPFKFDNKEQFLFWRHQLAEGLQLDDSEVCLIGSSATGRSLSSRTQYGIFKPKTSDVDIAVISSLHFEQAWKWFRTTNPNFLHLDDDGLKLFRRHEESYIFNGFVAAEYFLSHFPFGDQWLQELQKAEQYLPQDLRGRPTTIRIYRDGMSLRRVLAQSLKQYRTYLGVEP